MINEKLFINEIEVELSPNQKIARTLQINDIGQLDNRQTNFTKNIKIPKTPKNIQVLDFLGVMGNNSNLPYQKNTAKYYIGNECMIFNGWVKVVSTNETEYELVIYDGNVDFYKAIENTKLSDVGLDELNHFKNLTTIINSFSSTTLPYKYIVADYNGDNEFDDVKINSDYQVPSANIKFIWDKIFDYAGFSYSGKIFENEDFTNLWMTFPKPVPNLVPNLVVINQQNTYPIPYTVHYYDGNALLYRTDYIVSIFRENFSTPEAEITTVGQTTTTTLGDVIPNIRYINIKQNGVYALKISGHNSTVKYFVKNENNENVENGEFQIDPINLQNPSVITQTKIFNLNAGYKLYVNNAIEDLSSASYTFSFNKVDGYTADFTEVLVDFNTKDFVNEIMQRFCLTMQKDKYTNHLHFFMLDEILTTNQNNLLDWSDKLVKTIEENYEIGDYAQKNVFKYKYNEQNANHNDGSFKVNNVNLKDTITVIQSKIYSPDISESSFLGNSNLLFKIWDKEIDKDGIVKFKELNGRYYFLRYKQTNANVKIGSKKLNTKQDVTSFPIANFDNLKFEQIINKYYSKIASIINKSKLLTCEFYLNENDISNFDFKKLIYLKQFGSYFLVNKVSNFISGINTKVELIKVDYNIINLNTEIINIPINSTITINDIIINACNIKIKYTTNLPLGTPINLIVTPNDFGLGLGTFGDYSLFEHYQTFNTNSTNEFETQLETGGFYKASLTANYNQIVSNYHYFENNGICTVSSPNFVSITNVTLLSNDLFTNQYKIDFSSDAILPKKIYFSTYKNGGFNAGWSYFDIIISSTNSINVNLSNLFGLPSKIKIKIGNTESNEYNI